MIIDGKKCRGPIRVNQYWVCKDSGVLRDAADVGMIVFFYNIGRDEGL